MSAKQTSSESADPAYLMLKMHKQAIAEIARLQGENAVLRGLLSQCADVLGEVVHEADLLPGEPLHDLMTAVRQALAPVKGDLL